MESVFPILVELPNRVIDPIEVGILVVFIVFRKSEIVTVSVAEFRIDKKNHGSRRSGDVERVSV
jgi:hypothetical protein